MGEESGKEDSSYLCSTAGGVDPRVEKAIELLHADPRRCSAEIAQILGLSTSRLQHLIKRQVNITLRQVKTAARLARAVQLLEETTLSVKEISARLGYSQPPAFVREFRRRLGKTPLEWRKAAENDNESQVWITQFWDYQVDSRRYLT